MTRDEIVVMGNIVYHSGGEGMIVDDAVSFGSPPHYKYALWIEPAATRQMQYLQVFGNVLHPGEFGATNLEKDRSGSR